MKPGFRHWLVWLLGAVLAAPCIAAADAAAPAPDCPPSAEAALAAAAASGPASLVMADGQLVSWNLRVFLPQPQSLPPGARPVLCLLSGHAVADPAEGQKRALRALVIAQATQTLPAPDGSLTSQSGTVVLFEQRANLLQVWKPSMRVLPLLIWTGEDGRPRQLFGEHEVVIGQAPVAWALTGAVLAGFVVVLAVLCRGGPLMMGLLTADDGHLSLSKVQMALWTLAVGAVVFYFALLRRDVPSVPESLVVLMGLSLATTGISYRSAAPPTSAPADGRKWRWRDLVTVYDSGTDKPTELSLSRAQMLFWTGLLLIVFVAKTVLGGVLWDIPWSLVALMGISQAGYLAPKIVPALGSTPPPAA